MKAKEEILPGNAVHIVILDPEVGSILKKSYQNFFHLVAFPAPIQVEEHDLRIRVRLLGGTTPHEEQGEEDHHGDRLFLAPDSPAHSATSIPRFSRTAGPVSYTHLTLPTN